MVTNWSLLLSEAEIDDRDPSPRPATPSVPAVKTHPAPSSQAGVVRKGSEPSAADRCLPCADPPASPPSPGVTTPCLGSAELSPDDSSCDCEMEEGALWRPCGASVLGRGVEACPDFVVGLVAEGAVNKQKTKGEDRAMLAPENAWSVQGVSGSVPFSAWAVFDGHGGKEVAVFASKFLLQAVMDVVNAGAADAVGTGGNASPTNLVPLDSLDSKNLDAKDQTVALAPPSPSQHSTEENGSVSGSLSSLPSQGEGVKEDGVSRNLAPLPAPATRESLAEAEDALLERLAPALAAGFERCNAEACARFPRGGSTATLAVQVGWELLVAAVGDSSAYLDAGAQVLKLCHSHRLDDSPREAARIRRLGGEVAPSTLQGRPVGPQRVWPGGLAMSRSLGDAPAGPRVTARPDVVRARLPSEGARLVLASDGLWDALPGTRAVRRARACGSAREAARKLVADTVKLRPLRDDVTVVVVDFALPGGLSSAGLFSPRAAEETESVLLWRPLREACPAPPGSGNAAKRAGLGERAAREARERERYLAARAEAEAAERRDEEEEKERRERDVEEQRREAAAEAGQPGSLLHELANLRLSPGQVRAAMEETGAGGGWNKVSRTPRERRNERDAGGKGSAPKPKPQKQKPRPANKPSTAGEPDASPTNNAKPQRPRSRQTPAFVCSKPLVAPEATLGLEQAREAVAKAELLLGQLAADRETFGAAFAPLRGGGGARAGARGGGGRGGGRGRGEQGTSAGGEQGRGGGRRGALGRGRGAETGRGGERGRGKAATVGGEQRGTRYVGVPGNDRAPIVELPGGAGAPRNASSENKDPAKEKKKPYSRPRSRQGGAKPSGPPNHPVAPAAAL